MVKYLHVVHSVNPEGGGPIEGIKQLAEAAGKKGAQAEVLSLDRPDAPWVAAFSLPLYAVGPACSSYGYTPKLVSWLKEHYRDYDIVVVDGLWKYHGFAVRQVLRGTATPYVVFTHGMLDPWFKKQYPLKHLKKWCYWPWGEYRVLRDAAAVLFTTEEERLLARQSFWLYACHEKVMNYGTLGPHGDSVAQRASFFEQFPELRDQRILLFLGRVHEKKGCDLLLNAFQQILLERPGQTDSLRLVIAGPDDHAYARQMKELAARLGIADRIVWTGMLTGDLKWGAFYAAETFILPSHQENFGIAVAEALACGVPVLISNRVNIWREIEEDHAGLIETDDLEGTKRLLNRWLALSEPEWRVMQSNARDCFLRRFEISKAGDDWLNLLAAAKTNSLMRITPHEAAKSY